MPWVRFTAAFDWHAKPNVTIAYRAGQRYLVSQACATAALNDGKAAPSPWPVDGDVNGDKADGGR